MLIVKMNWIIVTTNAHLLTLCLTTIYRNCQYKSRILLTSIQSLLITLNNISRRCLLGPLDHNHCPIFSQLSGQSCFLMAHKDSDELGCCCGTVDSPVTTDARGPGFEYSHWQHLLSIYLQLTVCRKDENKEAENGPFKKDSNQCFVQISVELDSKHSPFDIFAN